MPIFSPLRSRAACAAACTALLTVAASADAQTAAGQKLDPVLQRLSGQLTGQSRVIVEFRDAPDVRAITTHRGRPGRRLGAIRGQVADVDNAALAALAADPRVSRVMIDRPAFPTMFRTGAAVGAGLARQQFDVTGRGIGIVIIDSGVTNWHDDLYLSDGVATEGPRVVHFKDFTVGAGDPAANLPNDPYGHGTHVAGIIAGSGYDSSGRRTGVAPGAHLIVLKVLDADGNGYISDVIAAIEYAVANKDALGIRVINLSVASGVFESHRRDPLAQAASRAVEAGIVVVAAAGNLGANEQGEVQYGGITSPGNAPLVLTVGASSHSGTARRSDDTITAFSSRGPTWIDFTAKPDLVAPGVGIESTADPNSTLAATHAAYLLDGTQDSRFKPYLSLSGTSMAAPVVAGAVALMLEANPSLTPNAVKAILQYTAQTREGESALAQGAGLLNVAGAVRMARFFADPTSDIGATVDTIEGEDVRWSRHIIWGNFRVTGGVPLPGANAWDTEMAWGAMKAPRGQPVVWGARTLDVSATGGRDNIVWATGGRDNIVWATGGRDNIVWATGGRDNIVWATGGRDNIVWATGGRDNIVWATGGRDNIVWATGGRDNIVWATRTRDNIVWATALAENVVWGNDCEGRDCTRTLWGSVEDGVVWGTARPADNIVWATGGRDNIVWATGGRDNIVWATRGRENIVWATGGRDNIVWATGGRDNIVWATAGARNIVWATGLEGDGTVWTSAAPDRVLWTDEGR